VTIAASQYAIMTVIGNYFMQCNALQKTQDLFF